MSIFATLLFKIIPLYGNILLGFLAGRYLDANRETIVKLMFYIFSPLIIFNGVLNTTIDIGILSLPLITFSISTILCLVFYRFSRKIWSDSSKNIMAFSAGTGNTGYFGLPIAIMLFNDQGEGVYIMALLGITFFENTLGFYMCARHMTTRAERVRKFMTMPSLYAFLVALVLNLTGTHIPNVYLDFMNQIKGAYTVLGMMVLGLCLTALTTHKIDLKFLGMTFAAKFIAWPLTMYWLIFIDAEFFHIYDPLVHKALMLISLVPLAINNVIFASLFNSQPEKAATAVLLSTFFALIYIPFMIGYFNL